MDLVSQSACIEELEDEISNFFRDKKNFQTAELFDIRYASDNVCQGLN